MRTSLHSPLLPQSPNNAKDWDFQLTNLRESDFLPNPFYCPASWSCLQPYVANNSSIILLLINGNIVFNQTSRIKLLQSLSQQQRMQDLNNTNAEALPKIPIELHQMELVDNSSEHSNVNFRSKKISSTQKLTPIIAQKPKYMPLIQSSSTMKDSPSNQEFLSSSHLQLNKKDSDSSINEASPTRFRSKKIPKGYELASYPKAVDYLQTQTYRRKFINPSDGGQEYEPLDSCGANNDLKEYGLGIYLYFEFIKRLAITFFIMSLVVIFPLITQYKGSGLSTYTKSKDFSMTLARFTLGNISDGDRQTYLIITIADVVTFLIMIIFYLHWRSFHKSAIEELEKDHKIVNPVSYTLSIEDFFDQSTNMKTLEQELRAYIDTLYKGAYQVEIVYNYNGNFDKFVDYDKQIELIQKLQQIEKQTNKEHPKYAQQKKALQELQRQIQHISQAFQPIYAIIHFRTLRAKLSFVNHCKRFKLIRSAGQSFQRALCCTPLPPEKFLFLKKFPVMIRNNKLSRPQEINWRNVDFSACSVFTRWLIALLLLFICIAITSALIGFCTLYVSSLSSCQNVVLPDSATYPTYAAQIVQVELQGSETAKFCYCSANFDAIYSDTAVNTYCSSVTNKILITNFLQIAGSVVSSITNIILTIAITLISEKVLRPNTIPKEYVFIFWGVLISNYINSTILPLALNGSIFGLEFVSYIKFVNFMDYSKLSVFKDFTADWYALITPYYVNMLIIASFISPIIGVVVFALKNCILHWRVRKQCEANDAEDPVIQKEINEKIASLQFDYPSESAQILLFLLIAFMYSGLIPVMIPIFTLGLIIIFVCKKSIIVKYSCKIAADETLNDSTLTFLPFVILMHAFFSTWSHTVPGVFKSGSPLVSSSFTFFNSSLDRVFTDIIITGEPALMILIILLDLTIFNFFGWIAECCKDELEMPVQWAAIENAQYSERLSKSNILGSYKLINNPKYGHALKAYNELLFRSKQNQQDVINEGRNPQQFS